MLYKQELASFLHKKMQRGWPDLPLLNHDKSWCEVPTEKMLIKWILEFFNDKGNKESC